MRRFLAVLLVIVAVAAALVWAGSLDIGPVLITREGEQKMVLLFGNPRSVQTEPGLSARIPLLEEVKVFDARYLYLNTPSSEIPDREQQRIVVDNYVVWRIRDPRLFYESFRGDRARAEQRINDVTRAAVRAEIGQRTIADVLTEARVEIMDNITADVQGELEDAGIDIKDVRINRTELPEKTVANVFARMRTERERQARKFRAEGEEEGRRIRADADREARVTVAEARRDAEILRGEGDARAAGIYADAYSADPAFYAFVRTLEAYRNTLDEGTTLVLPPESEFFRTLKDPETDAVPRPARAKPASPPPAPAAEGPGAEAAAEAPAEAEAGAGPPAGGAPAP